ncbi:MAG: class I SAM-dependent methyltransferase [Vicinamibacterales bacterium]
MKHVEGEGFSPRLGLRQVSDDAWLDFVERTVETLDIGPGTRVFEVGCGDGAFLLPLADNGYSVGGLDPSADLIRLVSQAIPSGRFLVGEAAALDPAEAWDVVLACGAFDAFPDLDYARGVLARMAAKATHAIAILDLPERTYDRGWMMRALAEIDVKAIQIEDQRVDGYLDAHSRFNVFARL